MNGENPETVGERYMKTIQDYLKECNRKEVINCYIYKYVFNNELMNNKYKNVTCGEIIKKYTEKLNNYIDKLIRLKPKKDDSDIWILVTTHVADNLYHDDIEHLLIKKSDLFSNKNIEDIDSFSYTLTDFEEILSFYVADTYLTQYNITDLIVDFLCEFSWTGFNHEVLKEEINYLHESINEIENGKNRLIPVEELFNELEEKYGFEFERKDKKQEEEYHKYLEHRSKYNKECKKIELEKLKRILKNEIQ